MKLIVSDLGLMDYGAALELQRTLVERRSKGEVGDVMLLLEHNHVITLGRKTSPENFKAQPIPVFQVERGGDATYHGPGQLVGYMIRKLDDQDVKSYLKRLEAALVRSVESFGISAGIREGHAGVWLHNGRKIVSIGIAVNNWVTFHGFALNVNPDLNYFSLIKPCGLDPDALTSIAKVTGKVPDMCDVKRVVVENIVAEFGYDGFEAASKDSLLTPLLKGKSAG
jgi:lipoate-protein ligase B